MKFLTFPGGWYADALPSGEYAVSTYGGAPVKKHNAQIDVPMFAERDGSVHQQPGLFTVIADDGVQVAVVGNGDNRAWRWDGQHWHDHGSAFGPFAVMFDKTNHIRVVTGPPAHGYRYSNSLGDLVTATDTYADATRQIYEYTDTSGGTIGQGGDGIHGPDPVIALVRGRRLIASGQCKAIRARYSAHLGLFAIAWVQEQPGTLAATGEEIPVGAAILWASWTEIFESFPLADVAQPPIDPPKPPEVPPVSVPDRSAEAAAFLSSRLKRIDGDENATREASFSAINALIHEFRKTDTRWGLLEKTGGDRVRDRAADVGLYQISPMDAQVVDMVSDAEGHDGPPRPGWAVKDIRSISQWREPYPLGGDDDDPGDTDSPPVPDDLVATIMHLRHRVLALERDMAALGKAKFTIQVVRQ